MDDTFKYELSDMDKVGMRKTVMLFILYELQPITDREVLVKSIIEGVKHATSQLRFIAGELQAEDSDEVYIVTTPRSQVEIKVSHFKSTEHKSLSVLAADGFHPRELDCARLLPKEPEEKTPVCTLQLSLIDGGLILGLCMNHAAGDWNSIDTFLSLACQSVKSHSEGAAMPTYTPDLTKAPFNVSSSGLEMSRAELLENLPGFHVANVSSLKFNKPPASNFGIYKILDPSIKQLKVECMPFLSGVDYISSYDCISALVWRVVTRARLSLHPENSHSPSRLVHPVDVRRRDPENKTSERYFGNAVIAAQAGPLTAETIVSEGPRGLALAASSIRRSVSSVNMSSIGYMTSLMKSLYPGETVMPHAEFAGMDLFMNSWYSGTAEKYDIGTAVPVAVRLPALMVGAALILPNFSSGETRAYEVYLELVAEEHELLRKDEEFLKYFEVVT